MWGFHYCCSNLNCSHTLVCCAFIFFHAAKSPLQNNKSVQCFVFYTKLTLAARLYASTIPAAFLFALRKIYGTLCAKVLSFCLGVLLCTFSEKYQKRWPCVFEGVCPRRAETPSLLLWSLRGVSLSLTRPVIPPQKPTAEIATRTPM